MSVGVSAKKIKGFDMSDAISLVIDLDTEEAEGIEETNEDDNVAVAGEKTESIESPQNPRKGTKKNGVSISIATPKKSSSNNVFNGFNGINNIDNQCNKDMPVPFTRDVNLSDPVDVINRITEVDAILDVVMYNFDFKNSVDQSMAMSFFNKCVSHRQKNEDITVVSEKTDDIEDVNKNEVFLFDKQSLSSKKPSHDNEKPFYKNEKIDRKSMSFEKTSRKSMFFEKPNVTDIVKEDLSGNVSENDDGIFYDFDEKDSKNKTLSVYEIESKFGFLQHYIQYVDFIKNSIKKESDAEGEEEPLKKLLESPAFIDMIVAEGNRLSLYFEDLEFLKKAVDGGNALNNSLYLFFMDRFK